MLGLRIQGDSNMMQATGESPQNPNPGSVAEDLLKSLATSILGKAAGSVLDPLVLGFLGTGDSSGLTAYLDKNEVQLAAMQSQLRQLQDSVDLIVRALPVIEEQFEDIDMQNKLDAVNRTSASITTNFQTYVNAVHALAANDPAHAKEAAREIFELMDVINLKSVTENMTVLQDLFVAPNAEAKGLLDLQHHYIRQGILVWAADREHYRYKGNPPCKMPSDDGVFESERIVSGGHRIADELLSRGVAQVCKKFISVQMQGLMLLTVGWTDSVQEPQLNHQIRALPRVLNRMADFEAAVQKTIDDEITACLQQYGQVLKGQVRSTDSAVYYHFVSGPYGARAEACPFQPPDWLMWETVSNDVPDRHSFRDQVSLRMINKPALDSPSASVLIWNYDYPYTPWWFYYGSREQVQMPRYPGIPAELQFVRSLRSAEGH
jgi:hypothetical protein